MGVVTTWHGEVAVVTLDWPEHRNSLDHARIVELTDALLSAAAAAGTVVLTGNGAFCSGGNLGDISDNTALSAAEHEDRIATHAQRLIRTIVGCAVPVMAAVDGPAIGLGFDLALACDDRLVGPGGWMMQGWARVGVLAGAGGQLLLGRLHPTVIWRLVAEQPRIDGPAAERWGLGESVGNGSAVDAAVHRGNALSALPRDVLHQYVSIQRTVRCAGLDEHLPVVAREQGRLLADPTLRARIASLRRSP